MFDVTTARQVDYTDQQGISLQATVFRDREDFSLWYMVPQPRLRIDNGQPTFNLTRYLSNAGGVAGFCAFEVELHTLEEAQRAAQEQIPQIKHWGEFTWISGDVFFDYELPRDGKLVGRQVVAKPSLFGTNQARFQISLANDDEVKTFIGAFTGNGGLAPFSITYQMGVLTQLLGAEATIKYTASVAIAYERTYISRKDTWGNTTSALVEIKQNLRSSGAGAVEVKKGAGGTDELLQLVRDWAWSALEQQVAQAIEVALRQAQGNESPITYISDIDTTYREDAIVEWSTPVSRFLPRFDPLTWGRMYHEIDNRQLAVVFELAGDYSNASNVSMIDKVEITVTYPTRKTDNTITLTPANSRALYIAPGEGHFNPSYAYQYTVFFSDGGPPFTSKEIPEEKTLVTLLPNSFGLRKVTFIGSDISFPQGTDLGSVKSVFIDFFEKPPLDEPPKVQTKVMTRNDEAVDFESFYRVPITNTYDFRLRYQLSSGDVITVQPAASFGEANADVVRVLSPLQHFQSFAMRAITAKSSNIPPQPVVGFDEILVNAAYYDDDNPERLPPLQHNWDGWQPAPQPGIATSAPWLFRAEPNPQTAFFKLNGQVIYSDGRVVDLNDVCVPYSRRTLVFKDTEEIYSAVIDSSLVDWTTVSQVTVHAFQIEETGGGVSSEILPVTTEHLRAFAERRGPPPPLPPGNVRGLTAYTLLEPVSGEVSPTIPLYFTLYRPSGAPSIVFYFNAEYLMKSGEVKDIDDVTVTNKLRIQLPAAPSGNPGKVLAFRINNL